MSSHQSIELFHQAIEAFNRRDLDGLLALMDEDVQGAPPLASLEGDYRGHAGIRRWWESLFESLPDFNIEVVEVRDVGDLTIATLRNRAHGAVSDTPVEQRLWIVGRLRNTKVLWWRTFNNEIEALEAAAPAE